MIVRKAVATLTHAVRVKVREAVAAEIAPVDIVHECVYSCIMAARPSGSGRRPISENGFEVLLEPGQAAYYESKPDVVRRIALDVQEKIDHSEIDIGGSVVLNIVSHGSFTNAFDCVAVVYSAPAFPADVDPGGPEPDEALEREPEAQDEKGQDISNCPTRLVSRPGAGIPPTEILPRNNVPRASKKAVIVDAGGKRYEVHDGDTIGVCRKGRPAPKIALGDNLECVSSEQACFERGDMGWQIKHMGRNPSVVDDTVLRTRGEVELLREGSSIVFQGIELKVESCA